MIIYNSLYWVMISIIFVIRNQLEYSINWLINYFYILGFLSYIKNYDEPIKKQAQTQTPTRRQDQMQTQIQNQDIEINGQKKNAIGKGIVETYDRSENNGFEPIFVESIGSSEISIRDTNNQIKDNVDGNENKNENENESNILPLKEIFEKGKEISTKTWQDMILRQAKIEENEDDLSKPPTKLLINLKAGGLSGGIDIFEGPPIYGDTNNNDDNYSTNNAPLNSILGQINQKSKNENLVPPDIKNLEVDQRNLFVLVTELNRTDFMMHESILDSYRDFLLCDNFLYLMREANTSTTLTYETRVLYSSMTKKVWKSSCFWCFFILTSRCNLPPFPTLPFPFFLLFFLPLFLSFFLPSFIIFSTSLTLAFTFFLSFFLPSFLPWLPFSLGFLR